MDRRFIQLLKLLHKGEVEEILEQKNLHVQLNYLVEVRLIEINDEEIELTDEGLEVLEISRL
jgi:predicted methyltransferase